MCVTGQHLEADDYQKLEREANKVKVQPRKKKHSKNSQHNNLLKYCVNNFNPEPDASDVSPFNRLEHHFSFGNDL